MRSRLSCLVRYGPSSLPITLRAADGAAVGEPEAGLGRGGLANQGTWPFDPVREEPFDTGHQASTPGMGLGTGPDHGGRELST